MRHAALVVAALLTFPALASAQDGGLFPGPGRVPATKGAKSVSKFLHAKVGRTAPMTAKAVGGERNLRVEVSVGYRELSGSASFLVRDGSQANHVSGGDRHFKAGRRSKSVELRKWGFIANVLPVTLPHDDGKVQLQIQLELAGPVGSDELKDTATWQYQTEVTLDKGKTTVLVTAPAHVEVKVSDVKD